jgi:hypothetical protein
MTVRDGKIVQPAISWNTHKFSPQMWEPFAHWVSENHPKDFEAMYMDGGSNYRITEESIRLSERHTRGYVEDVKQGPPSAPRC